MENLSVHPTNAAKSLMLVRIFTTVLRIPKWEYLSFFSDTEVIRQRYEGDREHAVYSFYAKKNDVLFRS
jgi:hypothetical protein